MGVDLTTIGGAAAAAAVVMTISEEKVTGGGGVMIVPLLAGTPPIKTPAFEVGPTSWRRAMPIRRRRAARTISSASEALRSISSRDKSQSLPSSKS